MAVLWVALAVVAFVLFASLQLRSIPADVPVLEQRVEVER